MSRSRLLLPMASLAVAFALGIAGGFVYGHEPGPREFRTALESAPGVPDSSIRGTLSAVGPDFLEVTTAVGARRFTREPATPIEELTPLDGPLPAGARVNIGGNRTESGFVITGVVVVGDVP